MTNVKCDMTKGLGRLVAETALQLCENCPHKDKCFADYTGICKSIEEIMSCFRDAPSCIASAATIEMIRIMREKQIRNMV